MVTLCILHHDYKDSFAFSEAPEPQPVGDSALLLLTPFTSLMKLTLGKGGFPASTHFDLSALQNLPLLTNLCLRGDNYQSVKSAEHLTCLSIQNSNTECFAECKCVSSLIDLALNGAGLKGFHTQGVCACSRLQFLECAKSYIHALDPAETMQFALVKKHISPPAFPG